VSRRGRTAGAAAGATGAGIAAGAAAGGAGGAGGVQVRCRSNAPMSLRATQSASLSAARGAPSRSIAPAAGAVGSPASSSGEPAARWKSPPAASANAGPAVTRCATVIAPGPASYWATSGSPYRPVEVDVRAAAVGRLAVQRLADAADDDVAHAQVADAARHRGLGPQAAHGVRAGVLADHRDAVEVGRRARAVEHVPTRTPIALTPLRRSSRLSAIVAWPWPTCTPPGAEMRPRRSVVSSLSL
jgi:hypothetical protein